MNEPKELQINLTEAKAELVKGEQSQKAIVNTSPKGNVTNTITVDETKDMVRKLKEFTESALETIRKGQYVEVDTIEYPTLEDFLESTGKQGTVYLYPVGNEANNYYQYIWEVEDWVSLGETALDLENVIRGTYISQSDYDDLEAKDENLYYFIPEE